MFFTAGSTFAVTDPLGGQAGEHVTRIAIQALRHSVDAGRSLVASIDAANLAIADEVLRDPKLRGAGCTIAVLQAEPGALTVAWVGDVRVYRLRGKELACLTQDHSLLNEYVKAKRLTPAEVASFPHKNVIVRALGMPDATADIRSEPREPGDVFVLATSGIYIALGDALLATILRRHGDDPDACARALLDDADANGGSGTVLVVPHV